MPSTDRRLRILTWHVHGNYLYYLSQVPHDFWLVTRPGDPPGHAGRVGQLPWGDNVHEIPEAQLAGKQFDCVLYQSARHYAEGGRRSGPGWLPGGTWLRVAAVQCRIFE